MVPVGDWRFCGRKASKSRGRKSPHKGDLGNSKKEEQDGGCIYVHDLHTVSTNQDDTKATMDNT